MASNEAPGLEVDSSALSIILFISVNSTFLFYSARFTFLFSPSIFFEASLDRLESLEDLAPPAFLVREHPLFGDDPP